MEFFLYWASGLVLMSIKWHFTELCHLLLHVYFVQPIIILLLSILILQCKFQRGDLGFLGYHIHLYNTAQGSLVLTHTKISRTHNHVLYQ